MQAQLLQTHTVFVEDNLVVFSDLLAKRHGAQHGPQRVWVQRRPRKHQQIDVMFVLGRCFKKPAFHAVYDQKQHILRALRDRRKGIQPLLELRLVPSPHKT